MRPYANALALLSLLSVVACSAKDAVALSAVIPSAQVTVKNSVFTTAGQAPRGTASGSFDLSLQLGSEASGSTTVEVQSFALRAEDGESLADPVPVTSDAAFPLVIDKGQSKTVRVTISATDVDRDAACAGTVTVVGSVADSLSGRTNPVESVPVSPNCDAN